MSTTANAPQSSATPVAHSPHVSPWRAVIQRVLSSRANQVCLVWLAVVALLALLAPVLAPQDPTSQDLANRFLPPFSPDHLLGTDDLGRDYLSRMLYGTRVSAVAPLIAAAVAIVLGIPTGLIAGLADGPVDWTISRIADTLMALPTLIMAIAIIGIFGPGLTNAMLAVGVAFAPRLFRLTRAATISVRGETYIEASRMLGCSVGRLMFVHVLPNIRSALLVQVTLLMSLAFLAEAGLSFLGLGVQAPEASWGSLLRLAFDKKFLGPWLIVPPGLSIMITILALNVLGDGVRDATGRQQVNR